MEKKSAGRITLPSHIPIGNPSAIQPFVEYSGVWTVKSPSKLAIETIHRGAPRLGPQLNLKCTF